MIHPQTKILESLKTPPANRDQAWEHTFLQVLPQTKLTILHEDPRVGPDGWPYLFVEITEASQEPSARVIDWLAGRGIGLAINPGKSMPDYVLSYGMLWNYKLRGEFLTKAREVQAGEVRAIGDKIFVLPPTEDYLPTYARSILRTFLKDQKVLSPKVLMVSEDSQNFDLGFSIESLGSPPEQEHRGICEALSWFLPAHYSIALIHEKRLSGFVDL